MPVDYQIRIPIEVYGRQELQQVYNAITGMKGAISGLSGPMREFVKDTREEANASLNLKKALDDIRTGATGATQAHRTLAAELRSYIGEAKNAEQATNKVDQAFGRIFARLGGREISQVSGVPGLGMISGRLFSAFGVSGATALGIGGAALGIGAGIGLIKQVEDTAKWAQETRNLSKELGITGDAAQRLGNLSEISSIKVTSVLTSLRSLSKEIAAGGSQGRGQERNLSELGLSPGVVFQSPEQQLSAIIGGLKKITDESERVRIAAQLGVSAILPLVDSFGQLSAIAAKGVLGKESLNQLADFNVRLKEASVQIDELKRRAAGKIVFGIDFITGGNLSNLPAAIIGILSGNPFAGFAPPSGSPDRSETTGPSESRAAHAGSLRLARADAIDKSSGTGVDAARLDLEVAQAARRKAREGFAAGSIPESQYQQSVAAQTGAENRLRAAERYRSTSDAFNRLEPLSELTPQEITGSGRSFFREFQALRGEPRYQQRQTGIVNSALSQIFLRTIEEQRARGLSTAERTFSNDEADQRDQIQDVNADIRNSTVAAQAQQAQALARGRQTSAISAFQLGRQSPNLLPLQIAAIQRQNAIAALSAETETHRGTITTEIGALQSGIGRLSTPRDQGLPISEAAQRDIDQKTEELGRKKLELETLEIDKKTKSIEIIDKFNDAVEKAAERMKDQFGADFASIILGAQRGGSKGIKGALRGVAEGLEGTILTNIGKQIWTKGAGGVAGKIGSHLPPWLTQGTVFGPQAKAQPVELTDGKIISENTDADGMNTSATDRNTAAINGLTDLFKNGGSYGANGSLGGIGPGTGPLSGLGGLGGVISHGFPPTGPGGAASGGAGSSNPLVGYAAAGAAAALGIAGVLTSSSTKGKIGAAAGGIGGIAAGLAAAGVLTGPAAPFIEGGAALLGLASTFLPDPRTTRANEISKRIFTGQYLAPQAQNISAGSGGGLADFDFMGNVRDSNFSPYPVVSNAYLDVPRRTVVPGHTESTFGGLQNVTGAKTPTQITVNVQTMDSKSFVDNAPHIMDAVYHGMRSDPGHPLIHEAGQQLGLR